MYSVNSLWIAIGLLLSMIALIEAGYRLGLRRAAVATEHTRTHINGIQASLLGVLALLLGFTFSLSLQRFDERSAAVVTEANAIGTAALRIELLPPQVREPAMADMRRYLESRVHASTINLAKEAERKRSLIEAETLQKALWNHALSSVEIDKNPVTSGFFLQALNEAFDAYTSSEAVLGHHVPSIILLLLYSTFLLTSGVVGYSAGVSAQRPEFVTYILVVLFVILAFIIVDLDRPRRGLIQVDQSSLVQLSEQLSDSRTAAGTR